MTKILLVSNRLMHYRVPVYNYFWRRFREYGAEFLVRSNEVQRQNVHPMQFDFAAIDFDFRRYQAEIERISPDVVIVFMHLRDTMIWPLVHWLKWRQVPVAFWSKAKNYDAPNSVVSRCLYGYMHSLVDGLILYSEHELKELRRSHQGKAFPANNTLNFEDYPQIPQSREEIKRELGIPFEKVVLSVGRMDVGGQRKKIAHLIDVFRTMTGNEIGLVIAGSGLSQAQLRRMNSENTRYLGEVHDPRNIQISKIFKMADLFSLPGHAGLGLNQAFYWGLPVITEEGSHPPEIHYLADGRNGFIVPQNDLAALKQKIIYLANDDDVRRTFSDNARSDILKNGSVANMFMGFKHCADALLDRKRVKQVA